MTRLNDRMLQSLSADDKAVTDSLVPGLMAIPKKNGANWILRFVSPVLKGTDGKGKRREMGLGVYPQVKLAEARDKAIDARKLIAAGVDPLEKREADRAAAEKEDIPTFGEAAKKVHKSLVPTWKPTDNVAQWLASVERHLAPILSRRVDTLRAKDFAAALETAWTATPRVAADVLQRASVIMQWCEAHEYINGDPTARVRSILGRQKTKTEHHPALPWRDAPAFVRKHLRNIDPAEVKRAVAFVMIHTACRPNEAAGMRRDELDLEAGEWVIGSERMKGAEDHHIPLAPVVVDLLRVMLDAKLHDDYVFPNEIGTGPIPIERVQEWLKVVKAPSDSKTGRFATPHGFRATFKGWSTNMKVDDRESERALAHKVRGEVKQAYDRDNLFDPRVKLMRDWADYLHAPANVVQLPAAA
jgi:integrase